MPVTRDVLEAIHQRRSSANPGSDLFATLTSYQLTVAEKTAGVTPIDFSYPPGNPRRNGAIGDGSTDDTSALIQCIGSNDTIQFNKGDIYAVTTITFPFGGPHHVDFNGGVIRGIATTATNCVVSLQMEGTTFIDYRVDGNFSQKYLCGTWWYNSAFASQYNRFFGIRHTYFGGIQISSGVTVRALIYGALVGNSSTNLAQSENAVYGWNTRGCQNPFYCNHNNGGLHLSQAIFVSVAEEWPVIGVTFTGSVGGASSGTLTAALTSGEYQFAFSDGEFRTVTVAGTVCTWTGPLTAGSITAANACIYNYAKARAVDGVVGVLTNQGGELQIASPGTTFAAELWQGCFLDSVEIETDVPILIKQDGVRLSGGRYLQDQLQPCFTMSSGCTGAFACNDIYFIRPAGVGAFDNNPIIDASAATGVLDILLSDTQSFEYRWTQISADVRLVKPGAQTTVRYKNHRMSMTAADANVYMLNTSPTDSILDITAFDRLGYTTNGWKETPDFGGATALTVTTNAGPAGYLASQLQLAAPSGQQAIATYGDPTSLATLKTSAIFVHPGDLYWVAAWCQAVSGTSAKLSARFFTITGTAVSDVAIADTGSIPTGSWKYIEGPLVVPATAAYMCLGLFANASTILLTDLRLRRAA